MLDKIINEQKKTKEDIIKKLNKLPSTDLMQISKIAKEIVDTRMEKCRQDGLFGEE